MRSQNSIETEFQQEWNKQSTYFHKQKLNITFEQNKPATCIICYFVFNFGLFHGQFEFLLFYNFVMIDRYYYFLNVISLIIHEEKTKQITAVSVVLYVMKNHVNLHKL
jgi:hypothetical protein